MNLDALVEIDRAVFGVDHDHRMEPGAGRDEDVVPVAADGAGLLDGSFDAAAAGGGKVLGQLPGIGQNQVPRIVPHGDLAS